MINSDKESLINNINQLQEKLNRKEAENFQNQLEINQLKKENTELMELLDEETSKSSVRGRAIPLSSNSR